MTAIEQGDVVLINYPTTDLRSTKKRPAVVISAHTYNQSGPDCVVIPITSQINRAPSQYEIFVDGFDQVQSGLYKPSLVKAGVMFTVEKAMIQKSIGNTPASLLRRILSVVCDVLSIPQP